MRTARAHRKFAIYSNFLDTILEGEEEILDGETRKDTIKRILKELEETAAELRKEANPHLYPENGPIPPPLSATLSGPSVAVIQTDKQAPEDRIAAIIADIYSCQEIKVLETYRLMAKADERLQAAYDQQLEALKNKSL